MALNPPLSPDTNDPFGYPLEHFLLKKESIEFEVTVKKLGILKGEG